MKNTDMSENLNLRQEFCKVHNQSDLFYMHLGARASKKLYNAIHQPYKLVGYNRTYSLTLRRLLRVPE